MSKSNNRSHLSTTTTTTELSTFFVLHPAHLGSLLFHMMRRINDRSRKYPLTLLFASFSGSDFYVCDFKGHCVAVFTENGTFQHRIGHEKITCFPNGIDISDAGDILIGDSHGNRFHVACFSRDGVLQSEFECPYVKVNKKKKCFP